MKVISEDFMKSCNICDKDHDHKNLQNEKFTMS